MEKFIIFTGGEIRDYSAIDTSDFANCKVICADSGYLHSKALEIKADYLIGDLDSLEEIPDDVDEIIKFPSKKDDTDTVLAIRFAKNLGAQDITIIGGLANRLDHTYANLQSLAFIYDHGMTGRIITDNELVSYLENSELTFKKHDGFSLSVFSITEKSTGVFLEGVKYPLENAELSQNFPLAVSNEITADFATVSAKTGKILIIQSKI